MAIIIRGKTKCGFCGAVIEDGQKVRSFPHFINNELAPLSVFDDGAFHWECFHNHPLAERAEKRYEECCNDTVQPTESVLCVAN